MQLSTGLARTQALLDKMSRGEVVYDFGEVMACPGGCIAGGGTLAKRITISSTPKFARKRSMLLMNIHRYGSLTKTLKLLNFTLRRLLLQAHRWPMSCFTVSTAQRKLKRVHRIFVNFG